VTGSAGHSDLSNRRHTESRAARSDNGFIPPSGGDETQVHNQAFASGAGPRRALVGPLVSSLESVSSKQERQAARAVVADYHDAQLGALVARVGEAVDHYRAGTLDAFEVDRVLFQYSRAAKELWKFCNYLQVEVAAAIIREQAPRDWWERGAPRER
jgi:hypothetical protein